MPVHVAYFRRVRDLLPPFQETEVRARLERLQELALEIDLRVQEFETVAHDLYAQRIGRAPWNLRWAYFRCEDKGGWQTPIAPVQSKASAEEWTTRPDS